MTVELNSLVWMLMSFVKRADSERIFIFVK